MMPYHQSSPRASPARIPESLHTLINETFKSDYEKRLAVRTMIVRHLAFLNDCGRFDDAHVFLEDQAVEIRLEAAQMQKEKRMSVLRVVSRSTLTALLIFATKTVAIKMGLLG